MQSMFDMDNYQTKTLRTDGDQISVIPLKHE